MWCLAVHVGAGRYGSGPTREAPYLALLHEALTRGRQLLEEDAVAAAAAPTVADVTKPMTTTTTTAVDAVTAVLGVLERNPLTNCGTGSNLTAAGRVECEASVACGRTRGVGACANVRGVAEPASLAGGLLQRSLGASHGVDADPHGREPPLVVVGDHARVLAAAMGLATAPSETALDSYQVTPAATATWRRWATRLARDDQAKVENDHDDADDNDDDEDEGPLRLDTVGAVCVDAAGNVAAAASSGGILWKVPGRVGLAGCPRMGCDARNPSSSRKRTRARARPGIALACSGRGEHFIRSGLVAHLTNHLLWPSRESSEGSDLDEALRVAFEDGEVDNGGVPIEGGVLAMTVVQPARPSGESLHDASRSRKRRRVDSIDQSTSSSSSSPPSMTVQLGVGFTTPCMGVGFVDSTSPSPRVQILRHPRGADAAGGGLSVHVSHLRLAHPSTS